MVLLDFAALPFNLFSDSHYIVHAVRCLETVPSVSTSNPIIQDVFLQIQQAIQQRSKKFYIGHIRAHSKLPGPLALGNQSADAATQLIALTQ